MTAVQKVSNTVGYAGSKKTDPERTKQALARGGIALLANSGLTAVLGVAFWVVAARILSAESVGRGLAIVSTMMTVSGLCQLNYARSLSGLLPQAVRPRRLLATTYGLTVALSVSIGLATAFIIPRAANNFSYLRGNVAFVGIFVVSVALWTIFTLEDTALTSVRKEAVIPLENGAYGVLKLVCLVGLWWAGYRSSLALFVSWVLPLVVLVVPINLYLFFRAVRKVQPNTFSHEQAATKWLRYDFMGYLLWLAGTLPLPLLVLMSVGATKAASFSVPFTMVQAFDLLSLMLGNSLTAEITRTGGRVTSAARSHLKRIWIMIGILSLLICALASPVLQVFGDRYRAGGTLILEIFMIANLPRSVMFLGIAVQRSRGRGVPILLLQAISGLGTLGLGLVLMQPLGAVGMAVGWLIASSLAALVAAVILAQRSHGPASNEEEQRTGFEKY